MQLVAAWSFASPWMLPWLATAAIPVVIHLWNRYRFREERWAATRFLVAALKRHQRRITIEQLLLLLTRVAVLVLLALALAEPIISGLSIGSDGVKAPPKFTILVVDASYSMGTREQGGSRFDRAAHLAAEGVREANTGDAFALVVMSNPPLVAIAEASADHEAVLREITKLELSHGGAELSSALAEVADILDETLASQPRLKEADVKFFTDLGRTTWHSIAAPEVRQQLQGLRQQAAVRFAEIGHPDTNNIAVSGIETPSRTTVLGESIQIRVEVENAGSEDEHRKRVELFADDREIGEQYLDIAAGDRAVASFIHQFETPGNHEVRARIATDALDLDDSRWLVVPVRESIRVLCVQGRSRAANFVAVALNPSGEAGARHHVEVASEYALIERDLHSYDCVFLCNVGMLQAAEANALQDFVAAGGGLIVGVGDLVDVDSYNKHLGLASETKLLPVTFASGTTEGQHYLAPRDYNHPLVAAFRGHERAGLLTVPIWRYLGFASIADHAEIATKYENGDAAIIAAKHGHGRVIIASTSLSSQSVGRGADGAAPWTALPAWPSFPPLMHEFVHFVTTGMRDRHNVTVGDSLGAHFPPEAPSEALVVEQPDGTKMPPDSATAGKWTVGSTTRAGVYRATYDESHADELFAVNLDTVESDLTAIDRSQLEEFIDTGRRQVADTTQDEGSLFRVLLCCAVVLLLSETVLAWFFGRAKQ